MRTKVIWLAIFLLMFVLGCETEGGENSSTPSNDDTGLNVDVSQNSDAAHQGGDTKPEVDGENDGQDAAQNDAADGQGDASAGQDTAQSDDVREDVADVIDDIDTNVDEAPLQPVALASSVTKVQPLTGIVLWEDSWNDKAVKTTAGNIQLEYAYVGPDTISTAEGVYDWTRFDALLNRVAARKHQAIIRFYFTYPGKPTTVPGWIKARSGYKETTGNSEGKTTSFPDWSSATLKTFYLDFFTAFAARYDKDPRLAYLQVGFGLWGEYHIYDGPNTLGKQFPDKAYQEVFMRHLDQKLSNLHWSISIDAGSNQYGPFQSTPALLNLDFGLFDDSFMHANHADYNASRWRFFGNTARMKRSPAGGELSYYTDSDQRHALDVGGMHGRTYEALSRTFAITYMIGNDQPEYQSDARIRAAGMANGYRFRVTAFKANSKRAVVEVENIGIAPIAYDAFVTVNGVRSSQSLKSLLPGTRATFEVLNITSNDNPRRLTIESDRLVSGQVIEYEASLTGN